MQLPKQLIIFIASMKVIAIVCINDLKHLWLKNSAKMMNKKNPTITNAFSSFFIIIYDI